MQFTFGETEITIGLPDFDALERAMRARFRAGEGFALATINLDHLVKLGRDPAFRRAYAAQDMIVADGHPVRWLSRIAGRPVELMPGSDLVLSLARIAAEEGARVALVGTTDAALADAAEVLSARCPGLQIVLCHAPTGRFDPDGPEAGAILADLAARRVQLCFLALGAPKQELFAARGRREAPGTGFASVGAGLDFLGGHQVRAPRWVRSLALEWLWRAVHNPIRLGPRYLRCAAILPGQILRARALKRRK